MFYLILGALFMLAAAAVPVVAPSVAPLSIIWGRVDPKKPDRPVIDWNAPAVDPAAR